MKKKIILCLILTTFLVVNTLSSFAQEKTNGKDDTVEINEKTGFPEIEKVPFVVWQEGLTGCLGTRIIKKSDRSNFVWQEYMAGAFFGFKTRNMEPINSTVRVSIYYPMLCNFNEVPQVYKNVIRFDADLFAAPIVEFNMWEYVRFNAALGLNVNVESTDRFLYVNVGPGALLGFELPVARHWTILLDGIACYDFADVGNNRNIEPVDYSFRYQLSLGVRYSKKDPNIYSYIPMSEEKIMTIKAKEDAKAAKKAEQKAIKVEQKALKAEKAAEEKAAKKAAADKAAAEKAANNAADKANATGN